MTPHAKDEPCVGQLRQYWIDDCKTLLLMIVGHDPSDFRQWVLLWLEEGTVEPFSTLFVTAFTELVWDRKVLPLK